VTVIGFNIWCSVPNFIEIGQFFTEIWRFNDFQDGGRPPSWILKKNAVLSCTPCRHAVLLPHTKFRWNRTIGRWVMAKKAIFKMAAAVIFNFKKYIFLVTLLSSCSTSAAVYQISSKSVDFWLRYGDLTIFKMAAVCHLGFYKFAVFVM